MTDKAITTTNVIEQVIIGGDLGKLTPEQRVSYYMEVCKSIGLNPMTRPFDYITLKGRLTLYARKDATEQLRRNNKVSIDKPEIRFEDDWIIVTVTGHDADGRADSDIGVVKKSDMEGNFGNALMKAVTKAKRRLTLSICGLGFLDETEIDTIPGAKVTVQVDDDFQDAEVIDDVVKPAGLGTATKEGVPYVELPTPELSHHLDGILKAIKKNGLTPGDKALYEAKRDEIYRIMKERNAK